MKKTILYIVIVTLLLVGCTVEEIDISQNIVEPSVNKYILNGTWALIDNFIIENGEIVNIEIPMGEKAIFKDEKFYVAGKYSKEGKYVLKNLTYEAYFTKKEEREVLNKSFNLEPLQIIDIYEEDDRLIEIIRLADNKFLVREEESFLVYEKSSEEANLDELKEFVRIEKEFIEKNKLGKENLEKSGILLGIKREIERDMWTYETRYIKLDKDKVTTLKIDNILIPRKNGFLFLDLKRTKDGFDRIRAYSDKDNKIKLNTTPTKKKVTYIGNDYISFETIGAEVRKLGVYPLDYMENNERIKLSEIIGKEELKKLNFYTRNRPEHSLDEYNFSVVRKSGYWGLEIREYLEDYSSYRDIELSIQPPKSLVNYDELSIPIWELKTEIDDLEDAFISPVGNLLVVEKDTSFEIYKLEEEQIIAKPLVINKDPKERVIMAEWATGEYVDKWEEELLKLKD